LAPFGHAVSEEKIFLPLANQKQENLITSHGVIALFSSNFNFF
jgi:hypothetical protein